ncbi:HNH endonuclease [Desertihabitans brevis]|nr:HNH endonuclease signature motif containing protein [Desertihabitans brevis]
MSEMVAGWSGSEVVAPDVVAGWVRALATVPAERLPGVADVELVDLLRTLEELKAAAEGLQAVAAVALNRSVRAAEGRRGLPRARCGRGVAAQVALARRESHARGRRHLGLAMVLDAEMPGTLAALRAGRITEWRAMLLARETACLSREDRGSVDAELAGDPKRLAGMGDAEAAAAARRLAQERDPASVVARRSRAESERRVSLRPAPDVMSQLSVLLPVRDGVAVLATLDRVADTLVAAGDGRSRDQIRADTLVDRVLGRDRGLAGAVPTPLTWAAVQAGPADVARGTETFRAGAAQTGGAGRMAGGGRAAVPRPGPVEVGSDGYAPAPSVLPREPAGETASGLGPACCSGPPELTASLPPPPDGSGEVAVSALPVLLHVVVADRVLLGASDEAGHLDGYGPVPADLVRELAAERAWVRRLYARPGTGELVAADSWARRFPARLAQLVRLRDQRCRMPWCGAPVRHVDHVVAVERGGATGLANGQGLCEACNYAKQAPGWAARSVPGPRHTVRTVTPTGHTYSSTAPTASGAPRLAVATP